MFTLLCSAVILAIVHCSAVIFCCTKPCNSSCVLQCLQEADLQSSAHIATGVPMTDLERQFFANSQPDDSSDSSSDSDQESMNAASEDDEDDGLDHF